MYAGASGDFNPMHHDEVAAQAAGLPSVFGHGMFTAGPARRRRSPTTSASATSRSYKVRFTKQTWPGETLTTHVTVAKKYDRSTRALVDLECSVVNERRRGEDPGRRRRRAARALTDEA